MGDVCCNGTEVQQEQSLANQIQPHISSRSSTDLYAEQNGPRSSFAESLHQSIHLPPSLQEKRRELGPLDYNSEDSVPFGEMLGPYRLKNGTIYKGEWKRGKLHGKGIYLLPNETVIECVTQQNHIQGQGRVIYPNGDYYEGQILHGKANGHGQYVEENTTYTGQFLDNLQHGQGIEKGQNYQFKGMFDYGTKQRGTLSWTQDNQNYEYRGGFVDDLFDGPGTLTSRQGRYEGHFRNGLREGKGKEFYLDRKQHFQGQFQADKKNGPGMLIDDTSGKVIKQGTWINDIFQQ